MSDRIFPKKVIYAGAWDDTIPYNLFPEIKLWISFDSQPNSEFGDIYTDKKYFKHNFIKELDNSMNKAGFTLDLIDENIRQYSKNDQIVRYHTNTPLPSSFASKTSAIYRETIGWDGIYVSGYDPLDCVLETVGSNPIFIGNYGTCYETDPENREYDNGLTARLWDKNLDIFSNYWFNRTHIFKKWEDFLEYVDFCKSDLSSDLSNDE
jgi:hypothetical protein